MLNIANTMTGRKEPFRPGRGRNVGMYVCGVTVYDRCHLGHARSAVVFDLIRRYLEYKKFRVRFVKNFTDVDDKIIRRAVQEGRSWTEVAETYIGAYREDMGRLGVRPADREPKATEFIPEMIRLIKKLIRKGHAYSVDGDVYYRVETFKGYGKLSKRKSDELLAGARVEPDERKENPLDFALWKAAKPGEPSWESPWGPGRPGWHIECSAMSMKLLGISFDIHGGGMDLIFPHHENEIAQSEGATGETLARYWVHNGFVNVNREKMSKSLGNFFTIQEIFEKSPWPEPVTAEVLRYFLLSTHYRSPIDFSDEALQSAKAGLDNFYTMFQKLEEQTETASRPLERKLGAALKAFPKRFEAAMDDDFNSAIAIGEMQQLRAVVNAVLARGISRSSSQAVMKLFRKYGGLVGLFQVPLINWRFDVKAAAISHAEAHASGTSSAKAISESRGSDEFEKEINQLVIAREEARKKKNWAEADRIRDELARKGVVLEDRPDGTTRVRR
ncbi:MAG TPA: cysteine--tRNA ligase [Nitrospiria bacterium]|jgi:cysteinyl-tRNA synthetase|nr:cysteine--tRNA ligase [Nitrospiria bacterium]